MKKVSALLVILSVIISMLSITPQVMVSAAGTTYYIDAQGNNSKDGISPGTAWADFANINGRNLNIGDQILLKRGSRWVATSTYPPNLSESFFCSLNGSGITVDAYGTGADPVIDGNGFKGYAFHILNRDNMAFQNITFKNISVVTQNNYTTYNHSGLTFKNLYLDNGEIRIENTAPDNTGGTLIKNIVIDGIRSENNSSLFASNIVLKTRISGDTVIATAAANSTQNVFIHDTELNGNQSGGISVSNCNGVTFSGVKSYRSAVNQAESTKSAVMLYKTLNIKFFNCMITDNFTSNSSNQSAVNNEYATGYSIFRGCYFRRQRRARHTIHILYKQARNDFSINHAVSNCTFINNGQAKTDAFGSLYRSDTSGANPEFKGSAQDNIFAETVRPGSANDGFTHSTNGADFKNWIFTNNVKIANSDFVSNSANDFKGIYGISKWKYQTFNGVKWTDMAYSKTSGIYINSKSSIDRFDTLPDDNSNHWTARVYIAPYNGTAQITGWAYMPYNDLGGNGANIRISLNGSVLLHREFSGTNKVEGVVTLINNILFTKGDILRFEVNCGANGNNNFDQVSWIPTVAYITANTSQSLAQSSSDDSSAAGSSAVGSSAAGVSKSSSSAAAASSSQPGSNSETKSSSQASVNSFHVNSTTVSEVPAPVKNNPISTIIILAILAIVIISGAVYARQAMKRDNSDEDLEDDF